MLPIRTVSVFCGSHLGHNPMYATTARLLGATLADRGISLVYGGASIGLMGVVADAVLAAGGSVTGIITDSLADHEIAHRGVNRLEVVPTMHERKARMSELSDAVIMLPGGFGTYEEFMESITWSHLGIHDKPSGVLNVAEFFDDLLRFIAHGRNEGFIAPMLVAKIAVAETPSELLDLMARPAGESSRA